MFSDGDRDPYRIELGANWIHGCINNPVFQIAKENKLLDKISCLSEGRNVMRTKCLTLREHDSESESRVEVDRGLVKYVGSVYYGLNEQADSFFTQGLPPGYTSKSNFQVNICRTLHIAYLLYSRNVVYMQFNCFRNF